jgi:hypothetical protein
MSTLTLRGLPGRGFREERQLQRVGLDFSKRLLIRAEGELIVADRKWLQRPVWKLISSRDH